MTPSQPAATAPVPPPGGTAAQGARGAAATPPAAPTRVELRNLATGAVKPWQDIQSFMFSANSTHLILRRRPRDRSGRGRGARRRGRRLAAVAAERRRRRRRGTGRVRAALTSILHNLATGRDQHLGSVGDIAFNKSGDLLAYTVDAAVKDGNGLFVIDLTTNRRPRARQRREDLQPPHLERRRHGARGAEGQRRREDARARQRPARVPERRGGDRRRRRPRR